MATADDYTWINDTHLEQAACFTVVPAADRAAVLAAYGAREGSRLSAEEAEDAIDRFPTHVIQVVDVGDALVVIEDNGYEGTRPEVLGPLSRASRDQVAAAFSWNVNALTSFTGARAGSVEFGVELIGADEEDAEDAEDAEDLAAVPAHLRPLVVEGGSEDGDMLGAGLALVATHTGTAFTAGVLDAGTWYEIEPTPESLRTHTRGWYDPLSFVAGGMDVVEALPPVTQRALAEWATRAAVREGGMTDDPVVREVLGGFGAGRPAAAPAGLDPLVRRTAQDHDRFRAVEEDHGGNWGGWDGRERRPHPFYEATVLGDFGPSSAVSHLEGRYLAQRLSAVEAVRQAANPDAFSAAVDCLTVADRTFENGRTTRGWTFQETAEGRWRGDSEPGPRHQQFVRVLAGLLSELAAGATGPDVWVRADAGLPRPLTDRERVEAIHADAVAAARGEFATYQVAQAEDFGNPEDPDDVGDMSDLGDGWDAGGHRVFTFISESHDAADLDVADHDAADLDPAVRAELDSVTWADGLAFLTAEVAGLDALLEVLDRPEAALATISAAPSALAAVAPLASRFGIGEDLARLLLATRLRPVRAEDLRRFREERSMLAEHLEQLRRR